MKIELKFYSIYEKKPEKGVHIVIIEANGFWRSSTIEAYLCNNELDWIYLWAYAPEIDIV